MIEVTKELVQLEIDTVLCLTCSRSSHLVMIMELISILMIGISQDSEMVFWLVRMVIRMTG